MAGSTWTWVGGTGDPTQPSNWTLTRGSGNVAGVPEAGDTVIVTGAGQEPQFVDQAIPAASTVDLTGAGSVQFLNDTGFFSNGSIAQTALLNAEGVATALLLNGAFDNGGTIQVTGSGDTLAITAGDDGPATGDFDNSGSITVGQGDTLTIATTGNATFTDPGAVIVSGGSALIDAAVTGLNNFAIDQGGFLEINQTSSNPLFNVTFQGPGTLELDQPAEFGGYINGFTAADTIDLGVLNIATVITDNNGDFTALNSLGSVAFEAGSNGGNLASNSGTFVLSATGGLAGSVQVTEGSGDTVITGLGSTTWQWNGASASAQTPADWTVVGGPGNSFGYPQSGDTAIVASGTVAGGDKIKLTGVTIELGGTAGIAAFVASGNGSADGNSPTIDDSSVIDSAVPGATTPESSLVSLSGLTVNDGTIEADGPAGSSFTLDISEGTVNGTVVPGYLINYNQIAVDPNNTMTIDVGAGSELYNASLILVNSGSLQIDADPNALFGGYAPGSGVILIKGNGSVETNVAYASDVTGNIPIYAFDSATAGATLKIDNIGSFGGIILGFGQGDSIDLGPALPVSQLDYDSSTGILDLENSTGSILASLLFGSGNFDSGTTILSGGTAGSFVVQDVGGDTVITTSVQYDTDAGTSGAWQSASVWSNGVPGTLDTAIIGTVSGGNPMTLTSGTSPVQVGAVVVTGNDTLFEITSHTIVDAYPLREFGGTVEIEGGETLTVPQVSMTSGTFELDAGSLLDLTGHDTYGTTGAIDNVITATTTGDANALNISGGSVLVNGGTIDGAPGQADGPGGRIFIGYQGDGEPGSMTVQGGPSDPAVVTDTFAIVSSDPTSYGDLTLNGNVSWTDEIDPDDSANTRGYMIVGYDSQTTIASTGAPPPYSGTATLTIENGATLTEETYAVVGDSVDSAGSVLVSDALWNIGVVNGGFLTVGDRGEGDVTVNSGGTIQLAGTLIYNKDGTSATASGIDVGTSLTASGTLTVENGGFVTEDAGMDAGDRGQGLVQILNGGTIALTGTNGINVGATLGSFGTMLVSGTDTATGQSALLDLEAQTRGLGIGAAGSGTVDIESGGTIDVNGTTGIGIGESIGAVGLLTINGLNAQLNEGAASTGMAVGQSGNGTVDITNGGTYSLTATGSGDGVSVGKSLNATGLIMVSGTESLLLQNTPDSGMAIGQAGSGTLEVQSGGTVDISSSDGLNIGTSASGIGSVVAMGGTIEAPSIAIGLSGHGTLSVGAAGSVIATAINAGSNIGSQGTLDVSGTGANLNASGTVVIGGQGSGQLSIGDGATVTIGGDLDIGQMAGGTGTADITDTTAPVTVDGNLFVGGGAAGTLTIGAGVAFQLDSGALTAGADAVVNLSSALDAPKYADNSGIINIDANFGQTYLAFVSNAGTYNIAAGVTHTLDTPLLNGGGLFNIGTNHAELVLNTDSVNAQTIAFTDNTGTLVIGYDQLPTIDVLPPGGSTLVSETNPNFGELSINNFGGTISNVVAGDTIIVDTTQAATFAASGSQIAVITNGTTLGTVTFTNAVQADEAISFGGIIDAVRCFAMGTLIETDRGPVAVEELHEGDLMVIAGEDRREPIIWIGRRAIDCKTHPHPEQVWPVRVRCGALGPAQPRRDLYLSPDHAVFVNDVLVPVKYLINGVTISQVKRREVVYFHLELPQHDLLLAENLTVESYLDVGDRSNFANNGGVVALFPDFTSLKWETEGCAPLVVTGAELAAARAVVETRAPVRRTA